VPVRSDVACMSHVALHSRFWLFALLPGIGTMRHFMYNESPELAAPHCSTTHCRKDLTSNAVVVLGTTPSGGSHWGFAGRRRSRQRPPPPRPPLRRRSGFRSGGAKEARFRPYGRAPTRRGPGGTGRPQNSAILRLKALSRSPSKKMRQMSLGCTTQ
jgi:hypothetical protein